MLTKNMPVTDNNILWKDFQMLSKERFRLNVFGIKLSRVVLGKRNTIIMIATINWKNHAALPQHVVIIRIHVLITKVYSLLLLTVDSKKSSLQNAFYKALGIRLRLLYVSRSDQSNFLPKGRTVVNGRSTFWQVLQFDWVERAISLNETKCWRFCEKGCQLRFMNGVAPLARQGLILFTCNVKRRIFVKDLYFRESCQNPCT